MEEVCKRKTPKRNDGKVHICGLTQLVSAQAWFYAAGKAGKTCFLHCLRHPRALRRAPLPTQQIWELCPVGQLREADLPVGWSWGRISGPRCISPQGSGTHTVSLEAWPSLWFMLFKGKVLTREEELGKLPNALAEMAFLRLRRSWGESKSTNPGGWPPPSLEPLLHGLEGTVQRLLSGRGSPPPHWPPGLLPSPSLRPWPMPSQRGVYSEALSYQHWKACPNHPTTITHSFSGPHPFSLGLGAVSAVFCLLPALHPLTSAPAAWALPLALLSQSPQLFPWAKWVSPMA